MLPLLRDSTVKMPSGIDSTIYQPPQDVIDFEEVLIQPDSCSIEHTLKYRRVQIAKDKSPWQLVQEGKAGVLFDRLEKENRGKIKQIPVYGPQEKSNMTKAAERIINILIYSFTNSEIIRKANIAYFKNDDITNPIELSFLCQSTNFNHILLKSEELEKIELLFKCFIPDFKPPLAQFVIYDYTTENHEFINGFLRGKFDVLSNLTALEWKINFLKSVSLITFLDQLPARNISPTRTFLYRMDTDPLNMLKSRIAAASNGGGITSEYGFVSTSDNKVISDFNDRLIAIVFVNEGLGKDIRMYADDEKEREVLLAPTQIQWLYHVKGADEDFPNVTNHIFFARAIRSPESTPTMAENAPPLVELPKIDKLTNTVIYP